MFAGFVAAHEPKTKLLNRRLDLLEASSVVSAISVIAAWVRQAL